AMAVEPEQNGRTLRHIAVVLRDEDVQSAVCQGRSGVQTDVLRGFHVALLQKMLRALHARYRNTGIEVGRAPACNNSGKFDDYRRIMYVTERIDIGLWSNTQVSTQKFLERALLLAVKRRGVKPRHSPSFLGHLPTARFFAALGHFQLAGAVGGRHTRAA